MPRGVSQFLRSSWAFHYLAWSCACEVNIWKWITEVPKTVWLSQAHTVSSGRCVPILKASLSTKSPLIYTGESFISISPCHVSSSSIPPSKPWKDFCFNHMGNAFSLFQIPSLLISLPKTSPQLQACIRSVMSVNFSQNQETFCKNNTEKKVSNHKERCYFENVSLVARRKWELLISCSAFIHRSVWLHVSNNGIDVIFCFPITPLWHYVIFHF